MRTNPKAGAPHSRESPSQLSPAAGPGAGTRVWLPGRSIGRPPHRWARLRREPAVGGEGHRGSSSSSSSSTNTSSSERYRASAARSAASRSALRPSRKPRRCCRRRIQPHTQTGTETRRETDGGRAHTHARTHARTNTQRGDAHSPTTNTDGSRSAEQSSPRAQRTRHGGVGGSEDSRDAPTLQTSDAGREDEDEDERRAGRDIDIIADRTTFTFPNQWISNLGRCRSTTHAWP